MPVMILAVVMVMMALIAAFVIVIAWERVPAMKWFAGGVVLLFAGAIAGEGSTWYYATVEGIGEVEVSREQYGTVAIGSTYTVSYSPRVHRAWTIDPSAPHLG